MASTTPDHSSLIHERHTHATNQTAHQAGHDSQALVLLIKRQLLQMRQIRHFQWSLPEGLESASMPSVTSPEIQQAILEVRIDVPS